MTKTDESKRKYRLAEAAAERRLAELREAENVGDLSREIAVVKFLLEENLNKGGEKAGTTQLSIALLQCLDRLTKTAHAIALKSGELVPRETLLQIGENIARAVAEELKASGVDDWEAAADHLTGKIAKIIASAQTEN